MAVCELTGKKPLVKNLVSHSHIKTKSRALPNVQKRRLFSVLLNDFVTLKIAASTLRSIEHRGGFDRFILKQKEALLSTRALAFRKRLVKRIAKKS